MSADDPLLDRAAIQDAFCRLGDLPPYSLEPSGHRSLCEMTGRLGGQVGAVFGVGQVAGFQDGVDSGVGEGGPRAAVLPIDTTYRWVRRSCGWPD